MKKFLFATCAFIALCGTAGASDTIKHGAVLAQNDRDPDARWNRGDRDDDVRRFNREERGERRDDGDDRRGDRDFRRRDRDERDYGDRDRGRDRDRDWDRHHDGDRDRYEYRSRRHCFMDNEGNRYCRN
jgi:hypothetical protein